MSAPEPAARKPPITSWIFGGLFLWVGVSSWWDYMTYGYIRIFVKDGQGGYMGHLKYEGLLAVAVSGAFLVAGAWLLCSCISRLRSYNKEKSFK